jgi:hypothetical protein
MDERQGSDVLTACFAEAGLSIQRDYRFHEGGVDVVLDGFDPAKRIGFEFITTEVGDRAEFTPAVVQELELRMRAEELFLFLIDERDVRGREVLEAAARGFLALLRDRGRLT